MSSHEVCLGVSPVCMYRQCRIKGDKGEQVRVTNENPLECKKQKRSFLAIKLSF